MNFDLHYHEKVMREDIPKLSPTYKERIRVAIEEKLGSRPEHFGKPLRRSLKGYRSLRVGAYRVIFRIDQQTIKIFCIQHRSVIYLDVLKRTRGIWADEPMDFEKKRRKIEFLTSRKRKKA